MNVRYVVADCDVKLDAVPPPADLVAVMRQQYTDYQQPQPSSAAADVRNAVLTQSVIEKPKAVQFNAAMKCFLVKGSGDTVQMVRFTPKPTCSCRPARTCYHITAVQRSIGTWTSPSKRTINLTQLRRNKRAVKQRPGRKRPRIGDCDVIAAPDAVESDGNDSEFAQDVDADVQLHGSVGRPTDHLQQLTEEDYVAADTTFQQLADDAKVVVLSCTLSRHDLSTVDGSEWLNDNVMHSYLGLLARTSADRIFVLPSFLAVRWENPSIDVQGWSYSNISLSSCKWLIMPMNVARSHWALLVADVTTGTVGIADSMPTPAAALHMEYFMQYMAGRAAVTGELAEWTPTTYTMPRQQDGHSCGVLALLAAEAVIQGVPLRAVDVTAVQFYRRYVKSRLLLNSRPYDDAGDTVCELPFCGSPSGQLLWTQCDLCGRWVHNICAGLPSSKHVTLENFVCSLC